MTQPTDMHVLKTSDLEAAVLALREVWPLTDEGGAVFHGIGKALALLGFDFGPPVEMHTVSIASEGTIVIPALEDGVKKPRLFFWEPALGTWHPATSLEEVVPFSAFEPDADAPGDPSEVEVSVLEIAFTVRHMSDAEFDALPES